MIQPHSLKKPFFMRLTPYATILTLLTSPLNTNASPPSSLSCDQELSLDTLRTMITEAESLSVPPSIKDNKLSPPEYTAWLQNHLSHSPWQPCGYPLQPADEHLDTTHFFTTYDYTHDGYISAEDDLNHDGIIDCHDQRPEPRLLTLDDPHDCAILTHAERPILLQYGITPPYANYTTATLDQLRQQSFFDFYRVDTSNYDSFSLLAHCVQMPHLPASDFPYILLIDRGKVLEIIDPLLVDNLEGKIRETIQNLAFYNPH